MPTLDTGRLATKPGPLMAGAYSFEVTVSGRGGHAAMPHLNADPVVAAAAIIQALQVCVGGVGGGGWGGRGQTP